MESCQKFDGKTDLIKKRLTRCIKNRCVRGR